MEKNQSPIWPGWQTVHRIGKGSFGSVYEIERDILGEKEKAALKVISIPQSDGDISEMYSDGYDDESITSTFKEHLKSIVAEYSLMRKMNGSANVVNCDDVRYIQHDDGIGWDIFIKMELLTPLTVALPTEVPEEQVVKIAKDLCHALVQCKQFGIVHRDIKPQNIFVSPLSDYKLGDFGIAKTVEKTSGGTKIGTYKYMAPEVYNNQPYGSGADIYSLGLVLYWLLNERRMPFMPLPPQKLKAGDEENSRLRRFAGELIPAPKNGSEELKRIVLKACAYDVNNRYHTADEMLADLEAIAGGKSAPVPPPAPIDEPEPEPDEGETGTEDIWKEHGQSGQTEEETGTIDIWDQPKPGKPIEPPIIPQPRNKKRPAVWAAAGIAAVLLIAVVCFFTVPRAEWEDAGEYFEITKETYSGKNLSAIGFFRDTFEVDYRCEYEYDRAGNEIKKMYISRGGTMWRWDEYNYDSNGYLIEEKRHYSAGGFVWIKYENDNAGNIVKTTYCTPDGSMDGGWYEHEYDQKGNKIITTEHLLDGSILLSYKYEYDRAGNVIREEMYYSDDLLRYSVYEYDRKGNRTKETFYEVVDPDHLEGNLNYCNEYKYDIFGNLIKAIRYNSNGTIYFDVEYDSNGDLAKVTEYGSDGSSIVLVG